MGLAGLDLAVLYQQSAAGTLYGDVDKGYTRGAGGQV